MAVVGIADVGMGMLQLPMAMLMGVPERAIAGVIHQILRRMIVLLSRSWCRWGKVDV